MNTQNNQHETLSTDDIKKIEEQLTKERQEILNDRLITNIKSPLTFN